MKSSLAWYAGGPSASQWLIISFRAVASHLKGKPDHHKIVRFSDGTSPLPTRFPRLAKHAEKRISCVFAEVKDR
jgi:hypothetical protein